MVGGQVAAALVTCPVWPTQASHLTLHWSGQQRHHQQPRQAGHAPTLHPSLLSYIAAPGITHIPSRLSVTVSLSVPRPHATAAGRLLPPRPGRPRSRATQRRPVPAQLSTPAQRQHKGGGRHSTHIALGILAYQSEINKFRLYCTLFTGRLCQLIFRSETELLRLHCNTNANYLIGFV